MMETKLLEDIARTIGPSILEAHRSQIISFASQNLDKLIGFVTPFILPALKALAIAALIVITAAVLAYITKRVVKWIRDELREEGLSVC